MLHQCPIYDLLDQITYQGKYQTVSKNGGLVIYVRITNITSILFYLLICLMNLQRKNFEYDGDASFVVVFVAHADNYECDTDAAVPFNKQARFRENRQISNVQFTVKASKKTGEYGIAILSLLGFNLVICLVIIIQTYLFYRFGKHYKHDHTGILLFKQIFDLNLKKFTFRWSKSKSC